MWGQRRLLVSVDYLMYLGHLIINFCYRAVDFVHNTTVRFLINPLGGWCRRLCLNLQRV